MKFLVCITHVPDTTARIAFTDSNTRLDENGVQFIIGPYDDYALARAVELKEALGAELTVLNVGPAASDPSLRKALAIGADAAVRIDTEPSDPIFVAEQIAAYSKDKAFDIIFMGRESIDFNGGVVHGLVGELLGIPAVSPVMRLELNGTTAELDKEIEGGKQTLKASLPLVLGCQEPIAEWKIPGMRGIMSARTKPLEVIAPTGDAPASSSKAFALPEAKGGVKLFEVGQEDQLVAALRDQAKVI